MLAIFIPEGFSERKAFKMTNIEASSGDVGNDAVAIGFWNRPVGDGEILFSSKRGASLFLRPDGTIEVNGVFVGSDPELYEAFGNVFAHPKSAARRSLKGTLAFSIDFDYGLNHAVYSLEVPVCEDAVLVGKVQPFPFYSGDLVFENNLRHSLWISHSGWVKGRNSSLKIYLEGIEDSGRFEIMLSLRQLMELDYTNQIK